LQVIDKVATRNALDGVPQVGLLWHARFPTGDAVERFVSEFIGPNMMWQRDWVHSLQNSTGCQAGKLPGRVQKRLAWQACQFTYLSRRGSRSTPSKATLAPG
jgi:hypothetical protein